MLIVYLDTQDFSRFGDVLRGVSDQSTKTLYEQLLQFRAGGSVVFPLSMPLLSELLQYDEATREICLAKAQAVESLCGSWAVPYPSRLVAMEIAEIITAGGDYRLRKACDYITNDRYWYPNIGELMNDFRANIRKEASITIDSLPATSFTQKRKIKAMRKRLKLTKFFDEADFTEFEEKLGIPSKELARAIRPFMRRQITSEQAAHRIFQSVAEPTKFIEVFYDRNVKGSEKIPVWITGTGRKLKSNLQEATLNYQGLPDNPELEKILRNLWDEQPTKFAQLLPILAQDDLREFVAGTDKLDLECLDKSIVDQIPAAQVFGKVASGYMQQVLGLRGNPAKIERSLAGDLIHLLYLSHVDLWRGDRRFSALVKDVMPDCEQKVVSRLVDLPKRISQRLAAP